MKEKISIIIPVYNVSEYIDKCLETVVSQTYKNIEIILIDDGSKDDSGKICDKWKGKDDRIVVIHKENGGLSNARNCGIDIASGKYIMFIDSDDIVASNICEILYSNIKHRNADIAICEVEHIFDKTKVHFEEQKYIKEFDSKNAIIEMWYQKSFLPSAWGKLYNKDLFNNIRFTEKILFEDIDIMHEIFNEAEKIVYNKSKLYGYVHRENSITTNKYSTKDLVILNIADKMNEFAKASGSKRMVKASEAYMVVAALRVLLNAPEGKEYKEAIKKSDNIMNICGKQVMKDKNVRRKTLYALYLYFYCRPLMSVIYKFKNRWS